MKPTRRRPPKVGNPKERLTINVSSQKIEGHGTCAVFEYKGKFFAKTGKGDLIKTLDFGKTWARSEETEKIAFELLLRQYSEQEKIKS